MTKSLLKSKIVGNAEAEQAAIRVVLGTFLTIYGLFVYYTGYFGGIPDTVLYIAVVFLFCAGMLLLFNLVSPGISRARRIAGIILDTSTAATILIVGGVPMFALYGIFLWVSIANGLRYGRTYMRVANVLSILAFSIVILVSDYWRQHYIIGLGLMLWLLLLPLYVESLLIKLEQAVAKANSANEAKGQFLANMSHEIRTPLTAIIGYGETALDKNLSSSDHDAALRTIVSSGNHLLTIINDILDVSKIDANQFEVEKVPVNIFQIVEEVNSILSKQAESKGIEFNVDYRFPLPAQIQSDPVRLKQVLLNICGNAIKFTQQGSVTITTSYQQDTSQLVMSISDTGIGLDKNHIDNIFEPFEQADSSITRKYGGTGLGLTLSKCLIEKMGGTIRVESRLGEGTTFYLELDLEYVSQENLVHDRGQLCVESKDVVSDINELKLEGKVLLAEDTDLNQQLFSHFLNKMGLQVDVADNGQIALDMVSKNDYDLIFMDMQMPVLSGLEAVEQLRRKGVTTRIIALTANTSLEDRERCLNSGCDDFVTKPIKQENFIEVTVNNMKLALGG